MEILDQEDPSGPLVLEEPTTVHGLEWFRFRISGFGEWFRVSESGLGSRMGRQHFGGASGQSRTIERVSGALRRGQWPSDDEKESTMEQNESMMTK